MRLAVALTAIISISTFIVPVPAQAYYFNWGGNPFYSYNGMSPGLSLVRSLGTVNRYAFNPYYNRFGYRYNGYGYGAWPAYLGSSLLMTAVSYGVTNHLVNKAQSMQAEDYNDEEPLSNPRQRVRPFRPSPVVVDQNVHAQRVNPQPLPYQVAPQQMAYQSSGYWPQPRPVQNEQGFATSAPLPGPGDFPSVKHSPLANGFVDMVNVSYDGDLIKALKNPEIKGWAQAIGIKPGTNISVELNEQVKDVLHNPSIDASTKVQQICALVK